MKIEPIFPIDMVRFQYPYLDELPDIIQFIEHNITHQVSIAMTPGNLHQRKEMSKLVNWFNECLQEYKEYYGLDCERISISSMWGNMTSAGSGDRHHLHKHPLSFVSGVFYLSEGSDTIFLNPANFQMFHVWKSNFDYDYVNKPTLGQLILFPSEMQHCTSPHKDLTHRHSISINTIPSGKVNYHAEDKATTWDIEVH